ncbi:LysR family transcriptional regulator [Simplicispira suum]|uniref:LysR family transcriptional regulator n=1 Tax=Simplicispira suum TaxID=2109915 RepID=A0A2S0N0K4_9BURK|nr:LysR substrate-binding domain-containing protein [Simplicispira suum]AVO41672.1 LysR family transcriptional regulator [Simplicispira suum]MBW7833956.1 LysR family transcriptional regulator [Simplicispira suum]
MRLRHIEIFNAVMVTGSVSGAARLINVTQPAVSRTLQHAELQLGFPLFERTAGRLVATAEARTLFPLVDKLFSDLDDVRRLAKGLRRGESTKTLRVLTVLAMSYAAFPAAVQRFRALHPSVVIHHEALHSPQIVDALVLQEADVGFLFGAPSHPALSVERLASQRLVCIVPKGLLTLQQRAAGALQVQELATLPVIGLDARDPVGRMLANALSDALPDLQPAMVVQTYHVALALAHHGVGVAVVEGCTAVSADLSRVDVVAFEPAVQTFVHAVRPTSKPHSQRVRAFTECMRQALAQIQLPALH